MLVDEGHHVTAVTVVQVGHRDQRPRRPMAQAEAVRCSMRQPRITNISHDGVPGQAGSAQRQHYHHHHYQQGHRHHQATQVPHAPPSVKCSATFSYTCCRVSAGPMGRDSGAGSSPAAPARTGNETACLLKATVGSNRKP